MPFKASNPIYAVILARIITTSTQKYNDFNDIT